MKQKDSGSMKRNRMIGNTVTYIILILMSIIWLFPFFGLIMQSFRSYDSSVEYGGMVDYIIPKHFSLDNYRFLFSGETNYLLWYRNTLIIAFFVALLQTIIILCVSYALSRMRFRGRTLLMRFWLILGMFPGFLTLICLYFLLKQFGLTQAGAVPGLILVSVASSGMGSFDHAAGEEIEIPIPEGYEISDLYSYEEESVNLNDGRLKYRFGEDMHALGIYLENVE